MRNDLDDGVRPLRGLEECTARWLTAVLRRTGVLQKGMVEAVKCDATSSTTAVVARLTLRFSADAISTGPRRLFLKIGDPTRLPNLPRDFALGDARFYERTKDVARDLPTPLCYDAAVDEESTHYYVLLEDLSETHVVAGVSEPPDREKCRAMVEHLADFHAYWWNHADLARFGGPPAEDEPQRYVASVQETLPRFLAATGDQLSSEVRALYERFANDFGRAYAAVFVPERTTVVHGDAHPFNVLLARNGDAAGRIIDWQFHHTGPCTEDVRHALGLCWNEQARRAIERDALAAYHRRLLEKGVIGYAWDDCWFGCRVGVIDNLFMPMWQWTLDMPPREWLPGVQRAVAAVRDLDCEALLA